MSYLSKDQYSRRNENAAIRMAKNAENSSLTEDQHEALSDLCKIRHELHSNIDRIVKNDEQREIDTLVKINIQIKESGLIPMKFISIYIEDFIDIDTISLLEIIDCISSEDENYDDWYDENYERIYNELEELNDKIEKYLSVVDVKYKTNYAPTGMQRIYYN